MPQLNPNPWFTIMLLTWFTYSFLIQPKLLSFTPTNNPMNKPSTTKPIPWTWPWT
ncbi:ATP synthase F0 subunit 8 (mitochondrion) [Meleagris gallopavo]|uniref:ATP synthase complex subunit 8 n=1 Tax=Meleagris gallopavo TaxID=9103 RepID=A9XBE3_MELGA|nr:ATP synthase F0 subunit 8 [Meleagris gallopavo]ABL73210.1 ATP synthase F0 subunit 8 [Meleagris gallopavo]ADX43868.1 ATP synthase F0 subunit 8 [Meleagris gallopavo]WOX00248.1 ATP synthase F0 subunit 8 [Meleagris gallopavo]WOX00261.1 ATP synthase F0 subunit 8 [Meleagris gallopavo]WOX00274.1 ATP synthase F0 subunit 8 [Meleagris gallopavo]